jgi:hypothetical protein
LANTYFVTGPFCAPVPGVIERDEFVDCANVLGNLSRLVRQKKVQSVVLGAAWGGYGSKLIERDGRRLPINTVGGQDAFYANLENYVRLLQGFGAKVYRRPTPRPSGTGLTRGRHSSLTPTTI